MSWMFLLQFAAAILVVGGVFLAISFVAERVTTRRWDKRLREQKRKELRYETWRKVGGR